MPSITSASTRALGLALGLAALGASCAASGADERAEPVRTVDGDRIEIVTPAHGDVVSTPVTFTIDRGSVSADEPGTFWLVVDRGCAAVGEELAVDEPGHIAVPAGEDQVQVSLPPGAHDICLQFADVDDVAYFEVDQITIRVAG
jgi:hypothetical protein